MKTERVGFIGVRPLIKALSLLKLGELMSYSQIQEIIGADPRTSRGRGTVLKAIKILRRPPYGIAILNAREKGYYRGNIESRTEWIQGQRDHCKRTMIEGFISSSVVDKDEFDKSTDEQKKRLSLESSRIGMELLFSQRLEKAKRLPPAEKIQPLSSYVGELLEKKKQKVTI